MFTLHHLVSLAELEQLRRGLCFLKFNSLIESHPDVLYQSFRPSEEITADILQDMFKPSFSPKGSNIRGKEEDIVMSWIHYLHDIQSTCM